MSRMTGTTAVTAGLGTLVLLNAVLGWGMQRNQPQARQDIPGPSAAALDPAVAFQLRSGAWRHWPAPAQEPAGVVFPASSPHQPLSATPAAQPNVPVASLAEPPPLDRTIPLEQLTRSLPPPPHEGAPTASTSGAAPSAPLPTVTMPPPSKDRMQLAGPAAEPTAQIEQDGPRERQPAAQSDPPQTEPPGNAGALPASKFGPDSFKRFERNGF
jgi:hypothetical protein